MLFSDTQNSLRTPNVSSATGITSWLAGVLILVFVYTAVSKWISFEEFKGQMAKQPFSPLLRAIVIWTLPPIEILASLLLSVERTKKIGFMVSACLLIAFTLYISLIMSNVFGRIPCTCGGIIQTMSWGMHLILNGFLLLVSLTGIYLTYRKGGSRQVA